MSSVDKKKNEKEEQSKETNENTGKEAGKDPGKYSFRKEGDEEELKEIYQDLESDVIKKGQKGDKKVKNTLLDMLTKEYHGR
jgi:hypothetical protein